MKAIKKFFKNTLKISITLLGTDLKECKLWLKKSHLHTHVYCSTLKTYRKCIELGKTQLTKLI
jgi:hypothetical protein